MFLVSKLQIFYPEELELVFGGCREGEKWDKAMLLANMSPRHGYDTDSAPIKLLVEVRIFFFRIIVSKYFYLH